MMVINAFLNSKNIKIKLRYDLDVIWYGFLKKHGVFMDCAEFMDIDYSDDEKIQKCIFDVSKDIERLVELSNDQSKYGKLIEILDPYVDKIDKHIMALQNRLTDELNKRAREFDASIASDAFTLDNFRREISKKMHIEKLTEQNINIRRILDKIRQTLII